MAKYWYSGEPFESINGDAGSQKYWYAGLPFEILQATYAGAIKTVNGLLRASVKTVNDLSIASVKTWNGLQ